VVFKAALSYGCLLHRAALLRNVWKPLYCCMRKYLSFTAVLLSLLALKARAQTLRDDSVKNIAIADAKKFKLDKARLTIFRQNAHQMERDYFEPMRPGLRPRLRPPGGPSGDTSSRRGTPDRTGFKTYRRNRELVSDFFKPDSSAVSNPALLKDSVYVKTYRAEAWKRTRKRRTFGHYAWVSAAVMGSAEVIGIWVFLFVKLGHTR